MLRGESCDEMALLGNLVDKCSVLFYRTGDEEGLNESDDLQTFHAGLNYVAQWKKPIIVQVNPFWTNPVGRLIPLTPDEQDVYIVNILKNNVMGEMDNDTVRTHHTPIDTIYCWSIRIYK